MLIVFIWQGYLGPVDIRASQMEVWMDEDRLVISDELWQKIEPLLPVKSGDPGVTARNNRRFLETIPWRVRGRRGGTCLRA